MVSFRIQYLAQYKSMKPSYVKGFFLCLFRIHIIDGVRLSDT